MKQNGIITVITKNATYAVRDHFSAPNRYVAHVSAPGLPEEPMHYDGRSITDCLTLIGNHIERTDQTINAVLKAAGMKGT